MSSIPLSTARIVVSRDSGSGLISAKVLSTGVLVTIHPCGEIRIRDPRRKTVLTVLATGEAQERHE